MDPRSDVPSAPPRHRVLVVDDNGEAADLLGELLSRAGHEVVVAYDGPQALEALDGFLPDVAVLDIGLPRIDGWELAQRLRERIGDQLRLIAVTGYGRPVDRARSAEVGFELHLVKPVEAKGLLRQIAWGPDPAPGPGFDDARLA